MSGDIRSLSPPDELFSLPTPQSGMLPSRLRAAVCFTLASVGPGRARGRVGQVCRRLPPSSLSAPLPGKSFYAVPLSAFTA